MIAFVDTTEEQFPKINIISNSITVIKIKRVSVVYDHKKHCEQHSLKNSLNMSVSNIR